MVIGNDSHKTKVNHISRQLNVFYKQKKKVRIYHGSTNSTRTQQFKKDAIISTSDLTNILEINVKKGYVIVEPNVPMDQLVKATLPYGMVPPVVMEFPGITVGGGIQGGAGESSTFKWGLFNHICLEYEIVLGNGEIITVSQKVNTELYWGTACSYGSLGIITKIMLKLIPAKKYVMVTYHRVTSFSESIKSLKAQVNKNNDFIDGILFSKNLGSIMTGVFSDAKDLPIVTFGKATDDWFYTHAEKISRKHSIWNELVPLEEYLFRYNRGAFWVGKYAFVKMKLPFTRLTRWLLNPLMHTRTLYRFLQAINISQRQIIQDLFVPEKHAVKFLEYIDTITHIYPLWLLPAKLKEKRDKFSPLYMRGDLAIDIGVWGKVPGNYAHLLKLNKDIEAKLIDVSGRKILYAHQYYTKEAFWKIYDLKWYKALRRKYFAEDVFPDVYEKTFVAEKYSFSVFKGLLNVLKSPFKLPLS